MTDSRPGWGDKSLYKDRATIREEEKQLEEKIRLFLKFFDKDPLCELGVIHVQLLGVFRIDYGVVRESSIHDMMLIIPMNLSDWGKRIEKIILEYNNQNLAYWVSSSKVYIFRIDKIVEGSLANYRQFQAGKWK